MKFPPETLMAYADGELDAETRRAIEDEMAIDPQLAQEIERHRAMRAEVGGAFAGVLDEPVPDRLLRAAKKAAPQSPATEVEPRRQWTWREWGSVAASLLIGVLAGRAMLQEPDTERGLFVTGVDGRVIAGGALAQALSEQLSSQDGANVDIGLSFRAKSGEYCRTFTTTQQRTLAGLACRGPQGWQVPMLMETQPASAGEMRTASSGLPSALLDQVDARMLGEPLDAEGERAARDAGWR